MKTRKPSENELEIAIVAAEQCLESGQDEHHVASALLYLYQRQQDLEKIREAAEQLLRSGQDESRLARLARAVDGARANDGLHSG
jgi:Skp family chaperone for outer membrane proteins